MNHVIIIGKNLNIFEDLSNFFENRNISIIKPNENNDLPNLSGVALSGLNIETIIARPTTTSAAATTSTKKTAI